MEVVKGKREVVMGELRVGEESKELLSYVKGDYTLVNDLKGLMAVADLLASEPVVGVDLEHNKSHSYEGFVCLV